ncbi:DUF4350 domain-containing protein [Erythrobacter sp. CCH5-A1]|jgi:hypothetical protein|uniref:DUF4350 domain-containing protein n=1 Tax=Erythrobacter sp. CCH5-A1 TaxID=1768792 RepID=UPI0008314A27|nr:DUF4350 domain-containing protein [Erythrobacter sp. CCH5-A1]
MSAAARPAAFSRLGAFALVAGGFALFLAMLWLMSADADFGGERGRGQAHASSNGLNGYAGLVRLVEAQGYSVERSRNAQDLKTRDLLVLTPGPYGDAEEIGKILAQRRTIGPTLVILAKWFASPPGPNLPPKVQAKFKRGWVTIRGASPSEWPGELPEPYRFGHAVYPKSALPGALAVLPDAPAAGPVKPPAAKPVKPAAPARWSGMGLSGSLPRDVVLHAELARGQEALITDAAGRVLAFGVNRGAREEAESEVEEGDTTFAPRLYPVIFVADPDLANNYGLADARRAAAAIALVDDLAVAEDIDHVVFDMTLNGFGASENLLTLAFRPPFLAATLCLLVALLIVGWRAFQRFGPAAARGGPDIAFGKRQLIMNGAGLIVRARRFRLLGAPYAALATRRLAERLGLARPDPQAIDAALARRLPEEEPFTRRAARLEAAQKPADILAAAQGLDDLATKLQQGPPKK